MNQYILKFNYYCPKQMEDELTYAKVEDMLVLEKGDFERIINEYPLLCITIALNRKITDKVFEKVKLLTREDATQVLLLGMKYNSIETIKFALKFGADVTVNNHILLEYAVKQDDVVLLKLLLTHGINIHHENERALILAAQHNKQNALKFLLDNEADVHILNDYPLREAVRLNSIDVVKILVEHGADVSVYDYVPFIDACSRGFNEIIKYFIETNQIKNINMMTGYPLYIALFNEHIETAELLLKNGADPNVGNTYLLDRTVKNGDLIATKLLIKYGANYKKNNGILYKIASINKDEQMMKLLQS